MGRCRFAAPNPEDAATKELDGVVLGPLTQDPYAALPEGLAYVRVMQCSNLTEKRCMEQNIFVSN